MTHEVCEDFVGTSTATIVPLPRRAERWCARDRETACRLDNQRRRGRHNTMLVWRCIPALSMVSCVSRTLPSVAVRVAQPVPRGTCMRVRSSHGNGMNDHDKTSHVSFDQAGRIGFRYALTLHCKQHVV